MEWTNSYALGYLKLDLAIWVDETPMSSNDNIMSSNENMFNAKTPYEK